MFIGGQRHKEVGKQQMILKGYTAGRMQTKPGTEQDVCGSHHKDQSNRLPTHPGRSEQAATDQPHLGTLISGLSGVIEGKFRAGSGGMWGWDCVWNWQRLGLNGHQRSATTTK